LSKIPRTGSLSGLAMLGGVLALAGVAVGVGEASGQAARPPRPPARLSAHRLGPRPQAVAPGTAIPSSQLFGDRVFADDRDGFALANDGQAQYPAKTTDGGTTWRIDGPQVHVDAADGPEGVGYVGVASARSYYAYGSQAIDVTTDGGRSWWQTFAPGLVVAVVVAPRGLLALVQPGDGSTWPYVSTDGGRRWRYSTRLGG